MLHYWGYLISGLISLMGFTFFSGISITLVKPLLDNVFKSNRTNILYDNFQSLYKAASSAFFNYFPKNTNLFFKITHFKNKLFWDKLTEIFNQTDPYLLLYVICGIMIFFILFKNIFYFGKQVILAILRGKTVVDIRNMIFHKYLYQSISFFNENQIGDSLVRITSDVNIVSDMLIRSVFGILQDLFLIIIFSALAIYYNSRLFFLSLLLLPLFGFVLNLLGNKIKKYAKRLQAQSSTIFSNIQEILGSMRIVKAFSREKHQYEKFDEINRKYFKFWNRSVIYNSVSVPLSELSSSIMVIVVLIIGGKQVLAPGSQFTFGSFMTFLMAIFSMLHPLKTVTKNYANIRKALVSLDRISEILDRPKEIVECDEPIRKKTLENSIEFKNVSFEYKKGKPVLSDINLTISKGEKIALVGGSGSGKTTLTNLLSRMYDVSKGEILLDGIAINRIKLSDLRRLFGTVTQESILFNDTIFNNIAYGSLTNPSKKDIEKAAKIAFADEFIKELPNKYNEMLNPKASNLSGGQKQRLCIARAIVGDPPILIFDEATSALDTEAERKVQKAIEQATKNRTVIVIAHRLSTILNSDKILVLKDGKIVEQGSHKELMKKESLYKDYYNMQFEID